MRFRRSRDRQESSNARVRIRAELERLGVSREACRLIALGLAELAGRVPPEARPALIAAAALGEQAGRSSASRVAEAARDLEELQRLLAAFHEELRKLDEALAILDAYARRMRTRTRTPKLLH